MNSFSPFQIYPIHHCKKFINACCDLINSEWPKGQMARLHSLNGSSDNFPVSFVLILNDDEVVGHCKVSEIKKEGEDVIVESVIIRKDYRGMGFGKMLIEYAEEYCRIRGKTVMFLSTKGQEGFYFKLGYEVCKPIHYYGFCDMTPEPLNTTDNNKNNNNPPIVITTDNGKQNICANAPPPPPLPPRILSPPPDRITNKTYMKKNIRVKL